MPCQNCNCGKIPRKEKPVKVASDNSIHERLYLMGFIARDCQNIERLDITDWHLVEEFSKKFSDQIQSTQNNTLFEITSPKLKQIFDTNVTDNFTSMRDWLVTLPRQDVIHFWRGYMDRGTGHIKASSLSLDAPQLSMKFLSGGLKEAFLNFIDMSECDVTHGNKGELLFNGIQVLDLLHELYKDPSWTAKYIHRDEYRKMTGSEGLSFKFMKTRPDAVAPSKSRASDSGIDVVLLEAVKQVGDITLYDTGIIIMPPYGWSFDMVPRSSIIKSGYTLANSVGVIDQGFRSSLLVALRKSNPDAPDLILPNRLVQIIPRQVVHVDFEEVNSADKTDRNTGGFGSSDVQK